MILPRSMTIKCTIIEVVFQAPNEDFSDRESRVNLTLLEFGLRHKTDAEKASDASTGANDVDVDSLLASHSDDNFKLSAKVVTNLVSIQVSMF